MMVTSWGIYDKPQALSMRIAASSGLRADRLGFRGPRGPARTRILQHPMSMGVSDTSFESCLAQDNHRRLYRQPSGDGRAKGPK